MESFILYMTILSITRAITPSSRVSHSLIMFKLHKPHCRNQPITNIISSDLPLNIGITDSTSCCWLFSMESSVSNSPGKIKIGYCNQMVWTGRFYWQRNRNRFLNYNWNALQFELSFSLFYTHWQIQPSLIQVFWVF